MPPETLPVRMPDFTDDEVRELVRRVDAGDEDARAAFARELADPARAARIGGDLAGAIENALIARLGQLPRHKAMAIRARLRHLRRALAGADASPVVALLAERAATCWLHAHALELLAILPNATADRRLHELTERAARRYLAALKALATVRRLSLPALQVNLARRQQIVFAPGVNSGR